MSNQKQSLETTSSLRRKHSARLNSLTGPVPPLPLFLLVVLLGGFLYLVVLIYQAGRSAEDTRLLLVATRVLTDTIDPLVLEVVYPYEVRLDPTAKSGQPMSVWLRWATPRLSPSPTPTGLETGTPTATPTPNPYLLLVEPYDDGLVFTDEDGLPVAPRIILTPALYSATPATLYVRRAPGQVSSSLSLTLSLYSPDGRPLTSTAVSSPLVVKAESRSEARWRFFLDRLLGPATPLLGMAAALLAFGVKWYEEARKQQKEEAKQSRRAEVERIRLLVVEGDLFGAFQHYDLLCQKTETDSEWKTDDEIIRQLREVSEDINATPVRRTALSQAARLLSQKQYAAASQLVDLVVTLNPEDRLAADLASVIELADPLTETSEASRDRIAPLLRVHYEFPELLSETVSGLLAEQIREGDGSRVIQLAQYELARNLLVTSDELIKAVSELAQKTTSPEVKTAADRLLKSRRRLWQQVIGWHETRPDDPPQLATWLRLAELSFNPFGPEAAELDPLLPTFALDITFERVRGARSVLAYGQPGSGKTAAALLLAHDCNDPPDRPREPGTLPVYYRLSWSEFPLLCDRRTWLRVFALAIAKTIIRYVAISPDTFLDLVPARQERLGKFLITCAGTQKRLIRQLRESAIAVLVDDRLISAIEQLDPDVQHASGLDEVLWIDLLRDVPPAGFSHIYLLIDVLDELKDAKAAIACLRTIVDLSTALATVGIYLKLFLPEAVVPHLGDLKGLDVVALSWDKQELRSVLTERIRQASREGTSAGRESLKALCDLDAQGMGVDDSLINMAATPRDLVRLGNQLLQIHVDRAPHELPLSVGDVEDWQDHL